MSGWSRGALTRISVWPWRAGQVNAGVRPQLSAVVVAIGCGIRVIVVRGPGGWRDRAPRSRRGGVWRDGPSRHARGTVLTEDEHVFLGRVELGEGLRCNLVDLDLQLLRGVDIAGFDDRTVL